MEEFYEWLVNIDKLDFQDKSVLILGAGKIANEYVFALQNMNIKNITVISRKGLETDYIKKSLGVQILNGGFEKHLPDFKKQDLVIVALPTESLLPASEMALKSGQTNILIEKPASLFSEELNSLDKFDKNSKIRIAYNRLLYPNFHKLKQLINDDGGITSVKFTFTEWIDKIDFSNYDTQTLKYWGIQNSLHVICMIIDLIGDLKQISSFSNGKLNWHPSGSCFVGSGISDQNIPFSYHSDWESGDRWGIEVFTKKNSYKLIPLEDLFVCPKNSQIYHQVKFDKAFSEIKQGLSEEIAFMLSENHEKNQFVTISKAKQFLDTAKKIFNY
jgi:predicted dehydrogenase